MCLVDGVLYAFTDSTAACASRPHLARCAIGGPMTRRA